MTTVLNSIEVDAFVRGDGINHRVAVKCASTEFVNLATDLNGTSIDGVNVIPGDRVLLRAQGSSATFSIVARADNEDDLDGTFWIFSTTTVDYYVFYGVTDPAVVGKTGIQVLYDSNDTAAQIRSKTVAALRAQSDEYYIDQLPLVPGEIRLTLVSRNAPLDLPDAATSGFTSLAFTAQTPSITDGIYIVGAGAGMSYRAPDLVDGDQAINVFVEVQFGDTNIGQWIQTNVCTTGTNNMMWRQRTALLTAGKFAVGSPDGTSLNVLEPIPGSVLVAEVGNNVAWSNTLPSGLSIDGPFTQDLQVVNKAYVDSVAAGLDPKESVRMKTNGPLTGVTYATSPSNGRFTNVNTTSTSTYFDNAGQSLAAGNRVLVANQADAKQNGIYVVTTASSSVGVLTRAPDQDGTPANEVSSGNFTFVELGASYQSTGWVLQGDGILTLNTDNLVWVQFSAYAVPTAGDGINIAGTEVSVDLLANGGIVFNGVSPNGELQVDVGATALTGTLAAIHGGTGQNTTAIGDLLVGGAANTWNKTAAVARSVLTTDSAGAPAWRNVAHLSEIRGASALEPELVVFSNTNAAVNQVAISNALTGVAPSIAAAGDDTNVSLRLATKGTGAIVVDGDTNAGEVRFNNAASTFYTGLRAGAPAANVTFTLPAVDGTSGQYMRTDGAGVLSFATIAASRDTIPIFTNQVNATTNVLTIVGYMNWNQMQFATATSGRITYETVITGGKTLEVEVFNVTTGLQLGIDSQTASGFYSFTFTLPVANARLVVRVRKTTAGGASPQIYGAEMIVL